MLLLIFISKDLKHNSEQNITNKDQYTYTNRFIVEILCQFLTSKYRIHDLTFLGTLSKPLIGSDIKINHQKGEILEFS